MEAPRESDAMRAGCPVSKQRDEIVGERLWRWWLAGGCEKAHACTFTRCKALRGRHGAACTVCCRTCKVYTTLHHSALSVPAALL